VSELESTEFASDPVRTEREGLPPGYRMRADPHYVDTLGAPARDRARDHARAAVVADAPAAPPADHRLLDHLSEDVAAIEAAAGMLGTEGSPLARRVGLDLIKAQAARAAWVLRAQALLGGGPGDRGGWRPLGDVLGDVRDRAAIECRLLDVTLDLDGAARSSQILVPEPAATIGLTGAIVAQLGLTAGSAGRVIRLRVGPTPGPAFVDVVQDGALVPPQAHARFFDSAWVTRPGGWIAALGASVAKAAADRTGGHASLLAVDRRGCAIRWALASADADDRDRLS